MNKLLLSNYIIKTIALGSKSFSVASKLFDSKTRIGVLMLYSWCRYCDDMIDNQQLGYQNNQKKIQNQDNLLDQLKIKTQQAYDGLKMHEPAFIAFQEVIIKHNISSIYAFDHLNGYAMDVHHTCYETFDDTLRYCYCAAGVVGIMIAQIIGIYNKEILDRACDLGLAFQLTNIARDVLEDSKIGRCYLPNNWLKKENLNKKNFFLLKNRKALSRIIKKILNKSELYYQSATGGLSQLPFRSALAVSAAKQIYHKINVKIYKYKEKAWNYRQSTSYLEKVILLILALIQVIVSRFQRHLPRSNDLWKRP